MSITRLSVLVVIAFAMRDSAAIAQAASVATSSRPIGEKIAIKVVPEHSGDTDAREPRACKVHLVSVEDQSRGLAYECDSWFQPPVGRYLFWLEQGLFVSFQSVLKYAGESDEAGLMLSKAMFPAGFVKLSTKTPIGDDDTFRVVSLKRIANNRAFDRRIAFSHAWRPVAMPVGNVIAGIFDRRGKALSLSKPQNVMRAATTTVHPRRPGRRSADVLAVLEHPASERGSRCKATLQTPKGKDIRPAVALDTHDRLVLAWYGVAAPSLVRVSVQCGGLQPFVQPVQLRRRTIETVRAVLRSS